MVRALLWKEVRGSWPFAVLVLVAQLVLCGDRLHSASVEPVKVFEDQNHLIVFLMLSVGFGVFLGFRQTLVESMSGTAAFEFQTARSRTAIAATKMAAGLALYGLAIVLPQIVTAGLIIGRCTYFMPPTWADTAYLWIVCWAGAASYLGALAIGLAGLPWKVAPRQVAAAVVFGSGLLLAVESPFLGWAVALLAAVTVLAVGWGWVGFLVREF